MNDDVLKMIYVLLYQAQLDNFILAEYGIRGNDLSLTLKMHKETEKLSLYCCYKMIGWVVDLDLIFTLSYFDNHLILKHGDWDIYPYMDKWKVVNTVRSGEMEIDDFRDVVYFLRVC